VEAQRLYVPKKVAEWRILCPWAEPVPWLDICEPDDLQNRCMLLIMNILFHLMAKRPVFHFWNFTQYKIQKLLELYSVQPNLELYSVQNVHLFYL
jgi:hypothetical protein